MKLDAGRVAAFLNAPGNVAVVLLHGPDSGLVAERGLALARTVPGAVDDPFRFTELHAPDAGTLLAEATAAAMTGGRRVVRVRDAGEALVKAVETLLRDPADALVILEAGDLTAKSRLRALVEKQPEAVGIGCYGVDAARIPRLVTDRLRAAGITIDPGAAAWVAANVPGEAGPLGQAVDMLILYAGDDRRLAVEDVAAALADGGDLSIQDAVDATLSGDVAGCDRALQLAFAEGISPVAVVRVLLGELMRLRAAVAAGGAPAAAMAAMRPPVFFKRQPVVLKALGLWSVAALNTAIARVLTAEAACKTTHIPDTAYCRQMMLGMARRKK